MSTLREVVSRVRSSLKLVSFDDIISDRFIASELRSTAIELIKRETNKRKLWSSPNIFTQIDCIELEQVSIAECCDFISDCPIRRSTRKLPKISEGQYGLLVQKITSIDKRNSFKESTPHRYANILNLNLGIKEGYFWIINGYLYISDPYIESVSISAYFEEDVPFDLGCQSTPHKSCPDNPLDLDFKCPGYLENTAVTMVITKLTQSYSKSRVDSNSDNKED